MTRPSWFARRLRTAMASATRASLARNHPGDVAHVCACGRKRLVMPLPRLSGPVCRQPPCACSWSLIRPMIVSRGPQLRLASDLCVGVASLSRLTGIVAKKLINSTFMKRFARVGGPLGVDVDGCACLEDVQRVLQRGGMALSGLSQLPRHVGCMACWFGFVW